MWHQSNNVCRNPNNDAIFFLNCNWLIVFYIHSIREFHIKAGCFAYCLTCTSMDLLTLNFTDLMNTRYQLT